MLLNKDEKCFFFKKKMFDLKKFFPIFITNMPDVKAIIISKFDN